MHKLPAVPQTRPQATVFAKRHEQLAAKALETFLFPAKSTFSLPRMSF
jgi:hypothetical protein